MKDARIHVYYGNGKGKTTAAAGLALRMLGSGHTVTFCQFLKDGESSEVKALKKFNPECKIMCYAEPLKFIQMMDEKELETCKVVENKLFMEACKTKSDLLVLDEVLDLVDYDILEEQLLLYFLDNHNETEVVLTGRNPSREVRRRADYITEMHCDKHPYADGLPARVGIEY